VVAGRPARLASQVMLHGRRSECDALERLLADAGRSRSGVLVVRGEAGVGKSALLDHAAGLADGLVITQVAKAWFIDRMVLLYEDMRARDPEYAGWER